VAPQPNDKPKDPKVGIYKALHELKMAAPGYWTAALNQLGSLEHKEILSLVAAPQDRILGQQGRAQMMHELIEMMMQCSDKTRHYHEQATGALNGHGAPISTG